MPAIRGYGAPGVIVVCEGVMLHSEFDLEEFDVRKHHDTEVGLIAKVLKDVIEAANEYFNQEVLKAVAAKRDREGLEGLLDCFLDAK